MTRRNIPSQQVLKQLFDYNPETGIAIWLKRKPEFINASSEVEAVGKATAWNNRLEGKQLGTLDTNGYLKIAIFNQRFWLHRIIWKWMEGYDPDQVDHIDGVRSNNSWVNLREVSVKENAKNKRRLNRNTTGVTGVSICKRTGKYHTYIGHGDTRITLGYFADLESARNARKTAEIKLGYHPNHGRIENG